MESVTWTQVALTLFNAALVFVLTYYLRKLLKRVDKIHLRARIGKLRIADAEEIRRLKAADRQERKEIRRLKRLYAKLERKENEYANKAR
jgi:hypothetical protein